MATANPVSGMQGPPGAAKKITGWYIAAAVLFIVLGIFASTVWAIGILVGVNLLMTGIARLMFGLAVRKVIPQTAR